MFVTTIAIGDRAMDSRSNPGTIKFIGKTQFDSGIWVGIELDQPVGKNNGTIEGVTYFKSGNKRGVFVRKPALLRRLNSSSSRRSVKSNQGGSKKFSPKKPFRGSTTSPSSSPKKGSPKSKTSASSSSMSSTNVKVKKRRKKVSTPRTNKVDPKLLEQRLTELKQHKVKAKRELALVKEKLLQVQSEHKNVQNIEKQNTNEQIKILKEQLKNEKQKREEMQKKRDKYALEELKSRKHLQSAKKKILTSELNLENKSEQLYILIDEILDSGPQNENWKKLKLLYSIVAIRGIKNLQSEMEKKISIVKELIEKTEKSLN